MRIPLVDLTQTETTKQQRIFRAVQNVVKKGNFILGDEVEKFEKNFATYIGAKYCVGVASGSDALLLSIKALGIGEGDEIIVPAMTFIATASSVIHAGAKPVFVDIQSNTPLIDPEKIESKITKRTKAIIPVHMHGYPCAMDEINSIAKKHGLYVIEDACQAHGSRYKNRKAGSLGTLAAFSFYPSKNLGAYGDAGAITTSDKKLYEKLKALRHHGQKMKSKHDILGYNSRLDSIQAAVLNVKLSSLDKNNLKRQKHADLYKKFLKDVPVKIHTNPKNSLTNYYIFGVQLEKRDSLLTFLRSKGIYCDIHYALPLHLQPALAFLKYHRGDFPNAEKFADETLSLPMYPELKNKELQYISASIKAFFK